MQEPPTQIRENCGAKKRICAVCVFSICAFGPQYRCDPHTGAWKHRERDDAGSTHSLHDVVYNEMGMVIKANKPTNFPGTLEVGTKLRTSELKHQDGRPGRERQ